MPSDHGSQEIPLISKRLTKSPGLFATLANAFRRCMPPVDDDNNGGSDDFADEAAALRIAAFSLHRDVVDALNNLKAPHQAVIDQPPVSPLERSCPDARRNTLADHDIIAGSYRALPLNYESRDGTG
ncbi:hypothetical protein BAUCODRAFT_221182 [Baudoinia panamericana UAMH 10762]|uniref:Uncharacterized protein n=1 Tax=Baudoinia panamericana (strain UAMH 10762) TaxID=717646 RepID=M2LIU0_BAUPA|nr:uncharacterized protein BAUCODRAFT_221182 [Baudoinia panamericana UAMH 10762]EMC94112.1 hypothetical protein BAUCODRAFT_221182 [Baudoinia panamericana UAMH 10762]